MNQIKILQKAVVVLTIISLIFSGSFSIIILIQNLQSATATSSWIQTSDQDFNNGTFDNIAIKGNDEEAKLELILPELHEWNKNNPSVNPGGRSEFPLATIYGTDKVMLFSGYSPSGVTNDTWVYDLSDDTWTDVKPGNAPRARYAHGLAGIYGTDKVLLYAGRGGPSLDETWVYDLSENLWSKKTPPSQPDWLYNFDMTAIHGTDKVLLYGGWMNYDETWIYDLSEEDWTRMYPKTNPGERTRHAMASIDGDDKVVLFGGYLGKSGTWVYDLSDNNWTRKTPSVNPGSREYHAMASIHGSDNVLLFGGSLNDESWLYDLSKDEWRTATLKNQSNKPSFCSYGGLASINGTNKIVNYGGMATTWLLDTWIYEHDLSIRNGTYISNLFDAQVNSSFKKIYWNASTIANTSLNIQLRSGNTGSDLNESEFVGPDGTATTYYANSSAEIWAGHLGDRWIQFKVFFNINEYTDSPILEDITISYNNLPTILVNSPINEKLLANNKPTFTWTFFDHDSQFQKAFQILIDDDINFTEIEFDSGEQNSHEQHWEFPLGTNYTSIPDGAWYWKMRTCDEDSDWTKYSSPRSLYIDTSKPYSNIQQPINDEFYRSLTTISGNAADPTNGSGVTKVEIAIKRHKDNQYWSGSNWFKSPTWLLATGTYDWDYDSSTIPWITRNKYSIQSRATDLGALTETSGKPITFTIDMDRPSSAIKIPSNNTWVNNLDAISGTSGDMSGSGIEFVEIYIQKVGKNVYWDGKSWINNEIWLNAAGTNEWLYNTNEVPWITGERYIINSRAQDIVNNMELHGFGTAFKYDNIPPEQVSINISNNEKFTTSVEVNLSLGAKDIGSGISQMSFSTDNVKWTTWEPFNEEKTYYLQPIDGEKIIYFRVKDKTGNIAEPVFDKVILDTTEPLGLTIVINDGLEFMNSNFISLSVMAVDTLSGIDEMSFSFNAITWQPWMPFTNSRSISFPAGAMDGEIKIYFRVSDKAGNVADPIFDTIILDRSPPDSLSIIINGGANKTDSLDVFLELYAEDPLSGVDKISLSHDNITWSAWEDYTKFKYYTISAGDGKKTVYFRIKDQVGNIAGSVYETIELNTTLPTSAQEQSTPVNPSSKSEDSYLLFLIIFILTLIVLITIGFLVTFKRMKQVEQELLLPSAVTVKPGALPGATMISDQIPAVPSPELLTSAAPSTSFSSGSESVLPSSSITQSQLPLLTKITQVPTGVKGAEGTGEIKETIAGTAQIPTQFPQLPPPPPAAIQISSETTETLESDSKTQPQVKLTEIMNNISARKIDSDSNN